MLSRIGNRRPACSVVSIGMRKLTIAMLFLAAAQAQPLVSQRPLRLEELRTQAGFEVSLFATGLGGPRLMAFGPNNVLYAATLDGTVVAIPQPNQAVIALRGLNTAQSLAFRGNDLYVSTNAGVVRYRNAVTADLVIRTPAETLITLPTGGHDRHTIAISSDGKLFVSYGSTCDVCAETDSRRATLLRYELDGSGETIYASGLRNAISFSWHPATGALWAIDNGSDALGDDVPPDEVNVIDQAADYGWPDCYADRIGLNWGPQARPGRCAGTRGPELPIQAHSAPLGISFYTGDQFPASFQNDAFVTLHGSFYRSEPTGTKVIRLRASGGRATGSEDFLWGFYDPATRTRSGRPVHVLAGPDGAVYVSDDYSSSIYRISYTGPRISPGGIVSRGGGIYELYGSNLANSSGVFAISANGEPIETLYTGASQVNFVLPEALRGDVTISVKNDKGADQALIRVD
jgi:glucose/arabinose dehydrogenase